MPPEKNADDHCIFVSVVDYFKSSVHVHAFRIRQTGTAVLLNRILKFIE